ncbi:cytochrome P450 [Coniochaeta ligniaria NRRL 30616]|uniref:Cytochrome P450 n=1 Tax=Coniochaeta ligniaria NRRL 30616 TaxID=1408157 RepID=A0A1J7IEY9_9PEZI|nr:cytochrome P450 [Coniochaeta ligniaria NRRL 30616]
MEHVLSVPLLLLIGLSVVLLNVVISGLRSPLSSLPGPWYTKFTNVVLRFQILTGRRIHYVDYLHQRYGPVVRIAPDEVAVNDVEAFSQIHKIGAGFLKSQWYDTVTAWEPGIFEMRDPRQHAARRRLFARAFSNSSLRRNWEAEIRAKGDLAVARIKADALAGGADILKWWTLMTTDVISHLAFGESFHMLETGKKTPYIDAIQSALLGSVLRTEAPWLHRAARWLPFEGLQSIVTSDDVVYEHGALAVRNMRNQSANTQNLFGQMLADADKEDKSSISDSSIRTEAGNFIVAGSDTTAVTLTYLVWAVLKNPVLQQQLEEEVAGLSPELDADELTNAPLLNSVIEETLRLYGAAPGALPRVVPGNGVEFCGNHIPGGTVVSTQAFSLHRDASLFPDPNRFDGYRFIDKSTVTDSQKIAFSPFGAGSRICLGLHLAWMELRLGAALFFRECRGARLESSMTDEMMEMDNRFLIAPKGKRCIVEI